MKKWPKIAVTPKEAHIRDEVLGGGADHVPSGHPGSTALKSDSVRQIVQHVSNVAPPAAQD